MWTQKLQGQLWCEHRCVDGVIAEHKAWIDDVNTETECMFDDVNTEHAAWIYDVNTETECIVDDVNTEHAAWIYEMNTETRVHGWWCEHRDCTGVRNREREDLF